MKQSLLSWSKVASKKSNYKYGLLWLVIGVIALLIVWLCSQSGLSQQRGISHDAFISGDFTQQLNDNLDQLKKLTRVKPTLISLPMRHSKKVRQNAPTLMYTNMSHASAAKSVGVFAGGGANSHFANHQIQSTRFTAKKIQHPDVTIASGEIIHAVLETAINSDLPGMVRATVSMPVYSYTLERLLIPAASRLIGQYTSATVRGQQRVMVVWNRLIRPDGVAVTLNSPGSDTLGRAGQTANAVNRHFIARFGQSALLSILGAGAASMGVSHADQYNSIAQYRMAVMQSLQQAASQSIQSGRVLKPTLHVYQGANINVFVAHDLDFYTVTQQGYK